MASPSPPPPGGSQEHLSVPNPYTQAQEAMAAAEPEDGPTHAPHSSTPEPEEVLVHAKGDRSTPPNDRGGLPRDSSNAPATSGGEEAPPSYSETLGTVSNEQEDWGTQATVADDGRVNIRIEQRNRRLSNLLVPALRNQAVLAANEPSPPPYIPPTLAGERGRNPPPPMNVVIHVVGSRGDVQPFVALGKVLKDVHNHRVRLATHPVFKGFVEENGLEFFSIGGDPAELMAFMVKNPGLMPGMETLKNGDVGKRRKGIAEIIDGCWRSCIEVGDGFGVDAVDATEAWVNSGGNDPGVSSAAGKPFVADAIIANPPSFAHVHCAEKLGIPLHMMFTMPWSPTQAFPHPLANIQRSNAETGVANYMSYGLVDILTWQGLGDIINKFRTRTLNLEYLSTFSAMGLLARLHVPYTYCWSPALIPKPKDWGHHISVAGFFFLSLASNYTPDPDLAAFLDAGPPPVYIGFGSIVVDDPNAMTSMIFEAIKKLGIRALVSKGWGGLGAEELGIPEGVFMLGNVPHDWLFKRVSCVVHHGGAGTTAAGIACGKPTVVVPFFGDQPFWGAMVAKAGAGPMPTPYKNLTSDKLAESIQEALKPSSKDRAEELATKISRERGCDVGASRFHQHLDIESLRCSILPNRVAVWRLRKTQVRLSALAAVVLANEGIITFADLKLYRPNEFDPESGPWDPVTGVAGAVTSTVASVMMGVADMPLSSMKSAASHGSKSRSHSRAPSTSATSDPRRSHREVLAVENGPSHRRSLSASSRVSDSSIASVETPQISITDENDERSSVYTSSKSTGPEKKKKSVRHGLQALVDHSAFHAQTERGDSPSVGSSASDPRTRTSDCQQFTVDSAVQTGRSVGKIAEAGMKVPMEVMMGLSKGFHNIPRLYGDQPRKVEKVTGFSSGLKVAGREFGQGLYEGFTGILTEPYKGAKEDGVGGFVKGIGKGMVGIAMKPQAAAFALPAYTMKGIYMEARKHSGSSVQNYIIAARIAQGWEDYNNSSPDQRAYIVGTYRFVSSHAQKKKNFGEREKEVLNSIHQKRKAKAHDHHQKMINLFSRRSTMPASTFDHGEMNGESSHASISHYQSNNPRSPLTAAPWTNESQAALSSQSQVPPDGPPVHSSTMPPSSPRTGHGAEELGENEWDEDALAEAIRQSVAETSSGNPEEDELVERAIRASLAAGEQRYHPDDGAEDDELRRALAASLAAHEEEESAERQRHQTQEVGVEGSADDAMHKREMEEALRRSLENNAGPTTALGNNSSSPLPPIQTLPPLQTTIDDQARNQSLDLPATAPPSYQYAAGGSSGGNNTATTPSVSSFWPDDSDDDFASIESGPTYQPVTTTTLPYRDNNSSASAISHPDAHGVATETGGQEQNNTIADGADDEASEDAELRRAIAASEHESRQQEEQRRKDREEEDIVLEYVKRQSLAEQEWRARQRTSGEGSGSAADSVEGSSSGAERYGSTGGGSFRDV
ncbi:hypothetical protein IWX90DRAFT_435371 [Phyllosticta citrichinensis]|uniref:Glycosyltransferase family 28 N-terminal domain-containing protein n=1 Tax=Phyllosticta citrichinensis TaxID=1130410 RepID=A0ABR1XQQ9_9PEZI